MSRPTKPSKQPYRRTNGVPPDRIRRTGTRSASDPAATEPADPARQVATVALSEAERLLTELVERHVRRQYLPALGSLNALRALCDGLSNYLTAQWTSEAAPEAETSVEDAAPGGLYL